MKYVEKYDVSSKGASRKFLDMPIDHLTFLEFP